MCLNLQYNFLFYLTLKELFKINKEIFGKKFAVFKKFYNFASVMKTASPTANSKNDNFKSSVLGMQGNLLSFALKLTANREEAQDLVQDTTLKALHNEEKFVDNTNFKGWMLTIMRNIFINNYRKSARENTMVDSSEDLFHLNLSQESGLETPEGAYACNEISSIIANFSAEFREPFAMHVAGYKYEEIADKLDMPLGTVKSRIFFARKKLRDLLTDYR